MKRFLLLIFFLHFGNSAFAQKLKNDNDYPFFENKGQIIDQDGKENPAVKYLFNGNGLNVQIKNEGFSYDVYEVKKTLKKKAKNKKEDLPARDQKRPEYDLKYQFHRADIDFVNANKNPEIVTEGKSKDYENYYNIPNKPEGIINVHKFQKITYKNLYPNIDLVFFKPDDSLKPVEYNFIVNPGGKISDIQLKFKGAKTKLKDGKLSMNLRFGEMQENIPHSWEENGALKNTIDVGFKDLGNGIFGFASEKDISDKTVVIDPVPTRIWGSYFGGNGEEDGTLKFDNFNNLLFYGGTSSFNNIATEGTYQPNISGNYDAFIVKISKNGQRIWGTYYGGSMGDFAGGADVDLSNNIFIAADTGVSDLFQTSQIVLLKFNPEGTLIFEKTFGGNKDDQSFDVKFRNNFVYIVGETRSNTDLTTPGAFQENVGVIGLQSGFLGKFDAGNGDTKWITYITGNAGTVLNEIFSTDQGIEIVGTTRATNFPMVNAFQPTFGGGLNNGLYVKFSESGNLIGSSYIGKKSTYYFQTARKFGDEIIFGASDQTYRTAAAHFYFINLLTNSSEEKSINLHKTFLPQISLFIDKYKNIFVTGLASPGEENVGQITSPDAYRKNIGIYISSYFTKYDQNLNKLWSTFYVGDGGTQASNLTKDTDESIYFWGMSSGNYTGIATPGTFQQTTNTNNNDMYIAKFADCTSNVNVSFVPACINQNLQLNASGGSTYEWFGPNGFHSFLQNPVINNAQTNDSGEYFVRITGGSSCGGIFSVIISIGSPTLPVLDIPNLPNITALCSVTITNFPTATTGCGTKIFATTTDPLSYSIPGTYTIHWKYNDGQGNLLTQNQNVIIQGIAVPTANASQNFCLINSPKISDIQISGTSIKWYDATGNILNPNTPLANGTKYFATQTLTGCESAKKEITAIVNDPNPPAGNAAQILCAALNPKISDIVVAGQNIKWFDAAGTFLAATTPLTDGKTYFATQTVNGCESTQKLAVTVSVKNGGIPANDYAIAICNPTTGNTKIENLNDYKGNLIANPAIYIFEFFDVNNHAISDLSNVTLNIGPNIFNVKISNSLGCFDFVKLTITLDPKPKLDLPESVEFCNGQSATLDAGGNGLIAYEWTRTDDPKVISNSQVLVVSTPGNYILKVENNFGCQNSTIIKVTQSVLAKIIGVQIVNSTATVLLSEPGNYEYSLDQIIWQDSNIFTNLKNGNYSVHVRTKLGCIIGSENFSIFNVSNVFTPDADGKNDTWKISGLENYPGSEIKIFDRFGNIVLDKISTTAFEWDGTFNSRKLPTGNYWYVIKVTDGRLLQGWLLLKNRN